MYSDLLRALGYSWCRFLLCSSCWTLSRPLCRFTASISSGRISQQVGSLLKQGLKFSNWRIPAGRCGGMNLSWVKVTSKRAGQKKNRIVSWKRIKSGQAKGRERWWERSRERPGAEPPVCLHSRSAAVTTSVVPSGFPHTTHLQPPSLPSPILSFYLPGVLFNTQGACWYAEQRWRGIYVRMGGEGGEQSVSLWRVSAAHMLSKESWHQSTAGNRGWGGDRGVDVL